MIPDPNRYVYFIEKHCARTEWKGRRYRHRHTYEHVFFALSPLRLMIIQVKIWHFPGIPQQSHVERLQNAITYTRDEREETQKKIGFCISSTKLFNCIYIFFALLNTNGLECNYLVILLFWVFLHERVVHLLDVFTLQVNNGWEWTDLALIPFARIIAFKL